MGAPHEAHESLKERARRALLDNLDPGVSILPNGEPQPAALPGQGAGETDRRPAGESPQSAAGYDQTGAFAPGAGAEELTADPDLASYADWIDLRLRALKTVRDLEPRRACFSERVRELTRTLSALPSDSIHYRPVLQRLMEAHAEWLALEEKLWAAQHVIRSTQWLVDLLAAPPES